MKNTLLNILSKWKHSVIVTIGGLFIGAGFADFLFAINQMDLNQIARALTIFSAGLTILVVMDNAKTQKENAKIQKATQLHLEKIENKLNDIHESQHLTTKQYQELLSQLNKANQLSD